MSKPPLPCRTVSLGGARSNPAHMRKLCTVGCRGFASHVRLAPRAYQSAVSNGTPGNAQRPHTKIDARRRCEGPPQSTPAAVGREGASLVPLKALRHVHKIRSKTNGLSRSRACHGLVGLDKQCQPPGMKRPGRLRSAQKQELLWQSLNQERPGLEGLPIHRQDHGHLITTTSNATVGSRPCGANVPAGCSHSCGPLETLSGHSTQPDLEQQASKHPCVLENHRGETAEDGVRRRLTCRLWSARVAHERLSPRGGSKPFSPC